ncbi:hypothetical protein BT96DRAFT_1010847 [Gymnopus androsaceus JB14]|uniref:Uncharacterized protein n=1 Tax=Gymnopus androsaceus JB14 TaxID=1447944 RepID=A0A6A4GA36_9AGAR|nr:hypothetical protein BT96DRAFT_1010847 [Gymnopus androsaceus JB14]
MVAPTHDVTPPVAPPSIPSSSPTFGNSVCPTSPAAQGAQHFVADNDPEIEKPEESPIIAKDDMEIESPEELPGPTSLSSGKRKRLEDANKDAPSTKKSGGNRNTVSIWKSA